jgi:pimeloyl-ACP methyl ester carboxylesterase
MSAITAAGATRISIKPENGGQIVGVLARPEGPSRATVVLAPGYEREIYHYSALSQVLVDHGYTTLRFDLRNHLGLSDGEVADFGMASITADITTTLRYAASATEVGSCALIAASLSARGAIRALAGDTEASMLLGLIPVVDVRYSLAQMMGEDLLAKWEAGEISKPAELYRLGRQQIKAIAGRDILNQDWGGVTQAAEEMARIDCPVFAVAAEEDQWVAATDVPRVLKGESAFPRACTMVELSTHEIGQNFPVMQLILALAVERLNEVHGFEEAPRIPDFQRLAGIMVGERRWARTGYAESDREGVSA